MDSHGAVLTARGLTTLQEIASEVGLVACDQQTRWLPVAQRGSLTGTGTRSDFTCARANGGLAPARNALGTRHVEARLTDVACS